MSMPREHHRIRAVLFDLDDTLLDWSRWDGDWRGVYRRPLDNLHAYLAAQGHLLPERESFANGFFELVAQSWEEARKTWAGVNFGDVLSRHFEALELDAGRIDLEQVMRAYDHRPIPGILPFGDALTVLESLKGAGYLIGLITNSMYPMWMRDIELEAYDMMEYFDVRISSGDTGYMKPHPAIYHQALSQIETSPEQAIFVGDRPNHDIAGANATGMISILMAPPHLNRALDGVEPDFTIHHLGELLPILGDLEQAQHEEAR